MEYITRRGHKSVDENEGHEWRIRDRTRSLRQSRCRDWRRAFDLTNRASLPGARASTGDFAGYATRDALASSGGS